MDLSSVALLVAGLTLVASGLAKVLWPEATASALAAVGVMVPDVVVRVGGGAEAILGASAATTGNQTLAWVVAAAYLGFAGFVAVVVIRRAPVSTCGCFGPAASPPGWLHVGANVAVAGSLALAASAGDRSLPGIADGPVAATWVGAALGLAGFYALIVVVPNQVARRRWGPQAFASRERALVQGAVVDPAGRPVFVDRSRPTALVFLSSSCVTCRAIWPQLRPSVAAGGRLVPVLAVTEDPDRERSDRVRNLAHSGMPVAMSSAWWAAHGVTTAPAVVVVDGNPDHPDRPGPELAPARPVGSWQDVVEVIEATVLPRARPAP